jgi:hypothetical protein
MTRAGTLFVVAVFAGICATPAMADVKVKDKGTFKLEGFLGRMVGMFGGKAAKDGLVTTKAVKGDRKVELAGDTQGRIVDLKEEKIYELDLKKKTYTVKTFEEVRRELREAREKAERDAPREEREPQEEAGKPAREFEFDFDVKETGQKKTIAGYETREVVITLTMREKGKALEEGGGFVLTSNPWMGPVIPEMKEFAEFEMRYWKAIAPEAAGMSPQQMAALLAMYPILGQAMERVRAEGTKLEGTPLATTMTFESVKSKEQMAQTQESGGSGLGGMLARRMKRAPQQRSLVLTTNHETLEVTTSVAPADLEIPAGFKERK